MMTIYYLLFGLLIMGCSAPTKNSRGPASSAWESSTVRSRGMCQDSYGRNYDSSDPGYADCYKDEGQRSNGPFAPAKGFIFSIGGR